MWPVAQLADDRRIPIALFLCLNLDCLLSMGHIDYKLRSLLQIKQRSLFLNRLNACPTSWSCPPRSVLVLFSVLNRLDCCKSSSAAAQNLSCPLSHPPQVINSIIRAASKLSVLPSWRRRTSQFDLLSIKKLVHSSKMDGELFIEKSASEVNYLDAFLIGLWNFAMRTYD